MSKRIVGVPTMSVAILSALTIGARMMATPMEEISKIDTPKMDMSIMGALIVGTFTTRHFPSTETYRLTH
jgi:hypothetical protein